MTRRRAGSRVALVVGALLGVGLVGLIAVVGRPHPPTAAPAKAPPAKAPPDALDPADVHALFARHLADYVVALDRRRDGADAERSRLRATIAALHLGTLAAPVARVLDAADPDVRNPVASDTLDAAVGRLNDALDAAALPYHVASERYYDQDAVDEDNFDDHTLPLLFAFEIERSTRYQVDGRVVRALRLTRLDDLAFDYRALGFAETEGDGEVLILTRSIDEQLVELESLLADEPALVTEVARDPAARREQLTRAVELHEVQHRVDLARWPLAMPAPLAALIVAPTMSGRFEHTAEVALAELSAYLAELARSPTDPRLRLALLVRVALASERAGDAIGYVAVVLLDQLARELAVGDREALIVGREIDPRVALARQRAITSRSSAELAVAAGALWQRWFGRPLPPVVQVGSQVAP